MWKYKSFPKIIPSVVTLALFVLMPAHKADAIPSFQRQTDMSCATCHTAYPELTSFGRHFKAMGYVMSKSDKLYEWPPPLSGVAKVSFTHTDKAQPPGSVENTAANLTNTTTNDFLYVPQILGVYYGGKIVYKFGALVQGNYEGVSDEFKLDITDVRFANMTGNWIYGVTMNNAPTLEDLWNSAPVWGFPYEFSPVVPTPAADPLINGALLENQLGGVSGYVFWNNMIYANVAVYRTTSDGVTEFLGAGTQPETVVDGAVPYWRLALTHMWGKHSVEFGQYGLVADVYPEGAGSGPTNQIWDLALDAQYQYLSGKHIFTGAGTWIHEKQDWDASHPLGDTTNSSDSLDTLKINLNYYYRFSLGTVGGTIGYFQTTGSSDSSLYAPDPVNGSRTGSPDSRGFTLEADFLLYDRQKLALQYTFYDKFNGATSNYDGYGRDASDNNTLFLLLRFMF